VSISEIKARLLLEVDDDEVCLKCCKTLTEIGFTVHSASKRGINFSGTKELFESSFQSELVLDKGMYFNSQPVFPGATSENIKTLYFPTQPTLF
jgi:hypothetical protein